MKKILFLLLLVLLTSCATVAERKAQFWAAYPNWSDEEKTDIWNNVIWVGMSEEQARLSWGRPSSINSSGGAYGSFDQWVYKTYYGRTLGSSYKYLYFRNGKLESWQQ